MERSPIHENAEIDVVAMGRTTPFAVPCPGVAHLHGDTCVICDAGHDGMLEVLITYVERDALLCASRHRPFEDFLAPRLVKLGLLRSVHGALMPTPAGLSLIEDRRFALS